MRVLWLNPKNLLRIWALRKTLHTAKGNKCFIEASSVKYNLVKFVLGYEENKL